MHLWDFRGSGIGAIANLIVFRIGGGGFRGTVWGCIELQEELMQPLVGVLLLE